MLKYILLKLSLFISLCVTGQENVYDVRYEIGQTYLPGQKLITEYQLLVSEESYYYSMLNITDKPEMLEVIKPEGFYDYHIGRVDGKYDYQLTNFLGKHYEVSDSLPSIKWSILNKNKTIAGFKCQKATGNYRGRVIEVYFTEEVPINVGPHKLHGLPGLIVYAISHDKVFEFRLKSFDEVQRPKKFYDFDFKNFGNLISLKNFLDKTTSIDARLLENEKEKSLRKIAKMPKGMTATTPEISKVHTTLELYYEWQLERD